MTKKKIKQWERFFDVLERTRIRVEKMNKEKIELIETILNDLSADMINTLYEIVVNKDFDYIENLFQTKEDFKEFIEKYKEEE